MAKCCPSVSHGTVGEHFGAVSRPRVPRGSVGEHFEAVMSPKGAEGVSGLIKDSFNANSPATKKGQSVARGCRAELLGNVTGL